MAVKKEVTPKEVKKELEKTFQDPNKNRLNLRCSRERTRIRQIKVT